MSEHTKQSLTSITSNKKDKKCKTVRKTIRLDLTLPESNEQACPELSYRDLLISAEKKRRSELKKASGELNGFDTSPSAEDAAIVRRLIAKHGDGGQKKLGRLEDFADLGAGYDETDPFIDNTDAIDEVIPDEMTTAHGGFYINSGALEFKGLSDQSDTDEPMAKAKRRVKRVLSIVDEDEDDEDDDDDSGVDETESRGINNVAKKSRTDLVGDKQDILKKRKLSQDRELLKKKKKRAIDDLIKKKSPTVKDLLKEKRETLEMPADVSPVAIKPQAPAPASITVSSSVVDVIESVASGAKKDEVSLDSVAVSKSPVGSPLGSESDTSQDAPDREKKEDAQLPDNLPDDVRDLIACLENAARTSAEGKCKFFSSEINEQLLRLEKRCGVLSGAARTLVYAHLAFYLPCTKDTLMKRAKKLHLEHEEEKIAGPMRRLRAAVAAAMPAVLEAYTKESQRVVEEKSTEDLPPEEGNQAPQELKIPRKVFPWKKELQVLLYQIIQTKTRCLELIYSRKENIDKNLHAFLDKDVKTLWPPGWMSVAKLLQESEKKPKPQLSSVKRSQSDKKRVLPGACTSHKTVTAQVHVSLAATATAALPNKSASVTSSQLPDTTTSTSVITTQMNNSLLAAPTTVSPTRSTVSNPILMNGSASLTVLDCSVVTSTIVKPVKSLPYGESNVSRTIDKTSAVPVAAFNIPNCSVDNVASTNTLDLSNGVNRTTTVIVPNSPHKSVNVDSPNVSTSPVRLLPSPVKLSPPPVKLSSPPAKMSPPPAKMTPPPMMLSSSVKMSTLPLSIMNIPDCISVTPAVTSPPTVAQSATVKPMMSVKQRIRQETSIGERNVHLINLTSKVQVNEVINDPLLMTHGSASNSVAVKVKRSKKRHLETAESVPVTEVHPPMLPPPICEKEAERQRVAETDAATNFISQIIHESYATTHTSAPSVGEGHGIEMNSYNVDVKPTTAMLDAAAHGPRGNEPEVKKKKKKRERHTPSPVVEDPVQLECDRVMNLLGELSSCKTEDRGMPLVETRVILPTTTLNYSKPIVSLPQVPRHPSIVGFQDAFQKHLIKVVMLRQKLQASRRGSLQHPALQRTSDQANATTAALEAELRRVQQLVGDLQRQRQELSVQVRQLTEKSHSLVQQIRPGPTGVTGAVPGRKRHHTTWLETDLDSLVTLDHGLESPASPLHPPTAPLAYKTSPERSMPLYVNADKSLMRMDPSDYETTTDEDTLPPPIPAPPELPPDYPPPPPPPLPSDDPYATSNGQYQTDISEADDRMKRFYGIIPREKQQEIKTVRIVKRESERRQKERDRSGNIGIPIVTNGSGLPKRLPIPDDTELIEPLDRVLEEDQMIGIEDDPVLMQFQRSMSLPRGFGSKGRLGAGYQQPPPPPLRVPSPRGDSHTALRNLMIARHRVRFESGSGGSSSGDSVNSQRTGSPISSGRVAASGLSAHEQLFGPAAAYGSDSPQLSPVFKSEAARAIVMETMATMRGESPARRVVPREKRRHHTITSARPGYHADPTYSLMGGSARSRDDLDMERALRPRINAPDVVRSTLGPKDFKYNENTIDSILGTPNKILIPERYIPEQAPELSVEEQLHRHRKAESIRKMLSETSSVSTPDLKERLEEEEPTSTLRKKVMAEKRQREHLLQLNQILAKQVMEKSKMVAGSNCITSQE